MINWKGYIFDFNQISHLWYNYSCETEYSETTQIHVNVKRTDSKVLYFANLWLKLVSLLSCSTLVSSFTCPLQTSSKASFHALTNSVYIPSSRPFINSQNSSNVEVSPKRVSPISLPATMALKWAINSYFSSSLTLLFSLT